MKYVQAIIVCLLIAACCLAVTHGCCPPAQDENTECPVPMVTKKLDLLSEASGKYDILMMPCNCGGIYVYEPDSCECFTSQYYPDLVKALNKTHAWFKTKMNLAKSPKYMGKYENVTLDCGCTLCVYIPDSCKCLEVRYPDLGKLLKEVYQLAQKDKEK